MVTDTKRNRMCKDFESHLNPDKENRNYQRNTIFDQYEVESPLFPMVMELAQDFAVFSEKKCALTISCYGIRYRLGTRRLFVLLRMCQNQFGSSLFFHN